MAMKSTESVHVGIDIGTTSAKCCVRKGKRTLVENRENYGCSGNGLQDAMLILNVARRVLQKTCDGANEPIDDVWICGQMHGVVFWNASSISKFPEIVCSKLYNWMFDYEDPNFVGSLPTWKSDDVFPGFGLATLAYLARRGEIRNEYDRVGTIMDLFAACLTGSTGVVRMSEQNAFSWGYSLGAEWQSDMVERLLKDFETSGVKLKLPEILPSVVDLRKDARGVVGLQKEARVHVPWGDLQASIASLPSHPNTAYLVLGTSSQLCVVVNEYDDEVDRLPKTVHKLPFYGTKKLLAACSMNGGNALEAMLKLFDDWSSEDAKTNLEGILEELDKSEAELPVEPKLVVTATFMQERGLLHKGVAIQGLTPSTTRLQLLEATHEGVVVNQFSLFPVDDLRKLGVERIALVGSSSRPRFARHVRRFVDGRLGVFVDESAVSAALGATFLAV